ncbi:MAG: hypothetical protein GY861_03310 [bacterium]|nr:hypothetical protein [bacterium]
MTKRNKEKFLKNLKKYTAPGLAAFFGQLALGVPLKAAALFALYVFYAGASDYFSKIK